MKIASYCIDNSTEMNQLLSLEEAERNFMKGSQLEHLTLTHHRKSGSEQKQELMRKKDQASLAWSIM